MARRRDWSELYPEILTSISGRLQTDDECRHFRSVCSNWRSSTHPIPKNIPILSPIYPHKIPHSSRTIYYHERPLTIFSNTTFLIQNPNPNFPKPWLITVEEVNPGKLILRKPLVRYPIKGDYPRALDFSQFRVRKIHQDYHFRDVRFDFDSDWSFYDTKVLLFSDNVCGVSTGINGCYAIVIDRDRNLLYVRLKNGRDYGYLEYRGIKCFDDIVCYKGDVWTIDRLGRVYVIRYDSKHLSLTRFADVGVCKGYVGEIRKCLIESDDGLYLIYRNKHETEIIFSVYKLNEEAHKWCDVKDLDGRILFVSSDCCFFAPLEYFPGCVGNCILFHKYRFWPHSQSGSSTPDINLFNIRGVDKVLEIGVFHMENSKSGLITTSPCFSDIFWPPPSWLSSRDKEENEDEIPTLDTHCSSHGVQVGEQVLKTKLPAMDVHPIHRDSHVSTFQNFNRGDPGKTFKRKRHIEPNLRDEKKNEGELPTLDAPCASNALKTKSPAPAMDVRPICRNSHASPVQNLNRGGKTFEKHRIKPNLIPTLKNIWEKHGNVIEGCTLRSSDMISSALESLATSVLILKKNTGRSLSESQADFLNSSLSDLQQMKFKVGWLVPFVEMALTVKKSRPLIDSLKEFREAKARAQELKMKVLDEYAKLDEIPALEEVNLDKCLGEGLC